MNGNIFSVFAKAAEAAGSRTFIEERDRVYTYADMLRISAQAAAALRDAGVVRGNRVLVQVEKSVTAVILYLACLRAGIVFIPLNTAYTAEEVGYFLSDAEPTLFVCSSEAQLLLSSSNLASDCKVLTLDADGSGVLHDQIAAARAEPAIAELGADTIAAILYTSGTTGRSKGAMLTHANLLSNVAALNDAWHWKDDDVLVHALPIFHAHGLFVALHCAMYRATTILFHPRFDAAAVLADLARATVFMGVPTFYVRLLKQAELNADLVARMRLFISGSAPLTETVFEAFTQRTGHRILERYGMTEALMITSNPFAGERVAGSVGFPLPGVTVRLAADEGSDKAAPAGLEIKGPNLFKGYWQQPEKTRDAFTEDGFFRTGDIATIDIDGRVRLVGRGTDLVISGGYNVYPKEIELLIDELPGVEETAVIGVTHPDFGEAVVAVVVPKIGQALQPTAVSDGLRGRLAAFKMPKLVMILDELPRNAMGKVEKAALRKRFAMLFVEK